MYKLGIEASVLGRTLTGAWIETSYPLLVRCMVLVAPSRVRGLKRHDG